MAAKQSTSLWVWAFLLLMLGSFVALVVYLDRKIVTSEGSAPARQQQPDTETKPVIDFYKVLPKRQVEIPISEEDREGIENPSINKEVSGQAILQVGSFKSADEAESLKAQLAFLGLQASVKSAKVSNVTWHRVQLGPFDSETGLSHAKNLLIENKIQYMQRSVP